MNQWCSKLVESPIKYSSNTNIGSTQLEICKLKLNGCFSKQDYFKDLCFLIKIPRYSLNCPVFFFFPYPLKPKQFFPLLKKIPPQTVMEYSALLCQSQIFPINIIFHSLPHTPTPRYHPCQPLNKPSWFLNSTVHLLHRLFLCSHISSYINSYPLLIWLALYTNFILSRSLSASVTLNL